MDEDRSISKSGIAVFFNFLFSMTVLLFPAALMAGPKMSRWVEVRSPHFIVESNAGKDKTKSIALQFEMIREALRYVFTRSQQTRETPLTILAVNSQHSLKLLLPDYFQKRGQAHPIGVFVQSWSGPYIILRSDAGKADVSEPSFNQYTHYFMRRELPYMPTWLSEGLGEVFSSIRFGKHSAIVGSPKVVGVRVLHSRPLIPLRTLLAVNSSSFFYYRQNKAYIFYAESWALAHYLLLSDVRNRTQHVAEYMRDVAMGGDPVETFTKVFGPLKGMRTKLQNYVHQVTMPVFRIPLPEVSSSSKGFVVRRLTQAQVETDQAEFLLAGGHPQKAEDLINKALQEEPQLGPANAVRGLLLLDSGERGEAAVWARKAIQLDPNDYRGYFYAAMAMDSEHLSPADSAAAEHDFQRAIDLSPGLGFAQTRLSKLYLDEGEKMDQAKALALEAARAEPENDAFLTNLELILLKQDEQAQAVTIEMWMLSTARTPMEKAMVRNDIGWALLQQNIALSRADHEIKMAARLAPKDACIQDSLGYLLKKEGNLPQAEAAFHHALSHNPKLLSSLLGLGDVLRSAHDTSGAIKLYLKALEVDPNGARAHYDLSLALKAKGDAAEAASQLKAARNLNPFNTEYQ